MIICQAKVVSALLFLFLIGTESHAQDLVVRNKSGMQLMVAGQNTDPTLRVVLPGQSTSDRSIEILFPEHFTIREHGREDAHQIYMFQPGKSGEKPAWKKTEHSLEYEKDLNGAHVLARATLEDDGVVFHYEITNKSDLKYDLILAIVDPRLTSNFHDERLDRTYVHHSDGFDLLASETPGRLKMPLDEWLPARYLVSYTWPVPSQLADRRGGIMYYNKSKKVDAPFIATKSKDGKWVIASFTHTTGNVWSNPELTCQHVDPSAEAAPGETVILESKILIIQGSVEDAFKLAMKQKDALKP